MASKEQSATSSIQPAFMNQEDEQFLNALKSHSKFKQRSHDTQHTVHLPELNHRLGLNVSLVPVPTTSSEDDPFAPRADLSNTNPIEVILLGNSMLERFKTTGKATRLGEYARLGKAWNAGVGGDTSENVNWRLGDGLYRILKEKNDNESDNGKTDTSRDQKEHESIEKKLDIKVWIVASGTNDVHPKKGLREKDGQAYKMLLQACLRIAPRSRIVACDVFYRKDVKDEIVDKANGALRDVVTGLNEEFGEEKIVWIEARHLLGEELLVDHVHLGDEGYKVWERVLWEALGRTGIVHVKGDS